LTAGHKDMSIFCWSLFVIVVPCWWKRLRRLW